MSMLFAQVTGGMDTAWSTVIVTLIFFAFFAVFSWWAWRPKNRDRLESYAGMALDDDLDNGELR